MHKLQNKVVIRYGQLRVWPQRGSDY